MNNYLKKFRLDNKTAFICGGAGLIGKEVSKALAGVGAHTVILDIKRRQGKALADEITCSGHDCTFQYFNVAKLETLEKEMERLVKIYRNVDIWVNVAYPHTKDWGKHFEKMKLNSIRENVDGQLISCAWITKHVAIIMKKRNIKGSIINFGSIYGIQANDFTIYKGTAMTGSLPYAMIKAGVINMTRYFASYCGKDGIRVNNVCPGGIFDHQNKKFVNNYSKKVPLKRMGSPEEVAAAVLFLASEAASYITGTTLLVDGGWTIV